MEIALLHLALLQGDFSVQRCGKAKDDAAFHLHGDDIRIHQLATVRYHDHPMHFHGVIRNADFDQLRDVRTE